MFSDSYCFIQRDLLLMGKLLIPSETVGFQVKISESEESSNLTAPTNASRKQRKNCHISGERAQNEVFNRQISQDIPSFIPKMPGIE
jgi:hypothetical protein